MKDYGSLPGRAMLVVLGDCSSSRESPSRLAEGALLEWIRRGGVLFVAGAPAVLPKELGVTIAHDPADCGGFSAFLSRSEPSEDFPGELRKDHDPPAEDGEVDGASSPTDTPLRTPRWATPAPTVATEFDPLPMRAPGFLRIKRSQPVEPLFEHAGYPMMVSFSEGRGRVIVAASASALQNRDIEEADGAVLFDRLVRTYAPGRPILFDEHHLGIGSDRSFVQYARELGAGPVLLQLALVLALLLWRYGARLGSPRDDVLPPPGGTASYVGAIAVLYERCGDPLGVLRILVRRATQQIGDHHHLPAGDSLHLESALRSGHHTRASDAVAQLAALGQATPKTVRELRTLARQIDMLLETALSETTRSKTTLSPRAQSHAAGVASSKTASSKTEPS